MNIIYIYQIKKLYDNALINSKIPDSQLEKL